MHFYQTYVRTHLSSRTSTLTHPPQPPVPSAPRRTSISIHRRHVAWMVKAPVRPWRTRNRAGPGEAWLDLHLYPYPDEPMMRVFHLHRKHPMLPVVDQSIPPVQPLAPPQSHVCGGKGPSLAAFSTTPALTRELPQRPARHDHPQGILTRG